MTTNDRVERIEFDLADADVVFFPSMFSTRESDVRFESLLLQIAWRQETVSMFGKPINVPRLTAWYGDEGKSYTYSGISQTPSPWTNELLEIKQRIEPIANTTFNSVLLNRYRTGSDSVSWHSDDEPELGVNPVIASVSFGQARRFHLKHKTDPKLRQAIELTHGSLLLMKGATQHNWLHQISKSKKSMGERLNLTFRVIR